MSASEASVSAQDSKNFHIHTSADGTSSMTNPPPVWSSQEKSVKTHTFTLLVWMSASPTHMLILCCPQVSPWIHPVHVGFVWTWVLLWRRSEAEKGKHQLCVQFAQPAVSIGQHTGETHSSNNKQKNQQPLFIRSRLSLCMFAEILASNFRSLGWFFCLSLYSHEKPLIEY